MAGGAEFIFISRTSPSKIKYQGLPFFFSFDTEQICTKYEQREV